MCSLKVHDNVLMMMMMMIMIMMRNCFCGMVDRRKAFSLISSRDHCQRSSPSQISDTPRAGIEPAQNLSSNLVEWSCAVVITTTPCSSDNHYILLSWFSNECTHDSLYVSKVTPVNKMYTQSCKRNASKVKVHSSKLNQKAPEQRQYCSGI